MHQKGQKNNVDSALMVEPSLTDITNISHFVLNEKHIEFGS